MDCSLPASSVHGISQARILEWVVMPFSTGSSWPGIKPISLRSPTLARGFFTSSPSWEALIRDTYYTLNITVVLKGWEDLRQPEETLSSEDLQGNGRCLHLWLQPPVQWLPRWIWVFGMNKLKRAIHSPDLIELISPWTSHQFLFRKNSPLTPPKT